MSKDDLKLLFETERRIFERRLRALFPSGGPFGHASSKPESAALRSTDQRLRRGPAAPPSSSARPALRFRTRRRAVARFSIFHWAISALVHGCLLIVLVPLLVKHPPEPEPSRSFTVRWIDTREVPKAAVTEAPAVDQEPQTDPVEVAHQPGIAAPSPSPSEAPPATPENATPPAPPEPAPVVAGLAGGGDPGVGKPSPLGSRYGEKAQALARLGGNSATEQAVAAGLGWLAAHQDPDGSWSPDGYRDRCPPGRPCHGTGLPEYRVGVTALALLAFLGAGVTGDPAHPHHDCLARGLTFLIEAQDPDGCFGERRGNYLYNHGIALFCLSEAALLTRDRKIADAVERGLAFAARAQQPGGGWDYTTSRTLRNDLSITGWLVMGMHTARQAGIPYAPEMEQGVRRFIERTVHRSGWSTYADRGVGQDRGGMSIAAVGMLTKLYLGWSPLATELERTVDLLLRRPPDAEARLDWDRSFQSSYYWYYATLALFHCGGEPWEAWNVLLQRTVLPLQQERQHLAGSWDPDPNWIGAAGGRVATTALVVLTFEVYYRYTPLWQQLRLGTTGELRPR